MGRTNRLIRRCSRRTGTGFPRKTAIDGRTMRHASGGYRVLSVLLREYDHTSVPQVQ
jgi:hypothetical protein